MEGSPSGEVPFMPQAKQLLDLNLVGARSVS